MRLIRPALLLLALLVPAASHAYTFGLYGVSLRWDQCYADGGVANKNFACDTNAGSETLVGSFVPAWDIQHVAGLDILIHLASASPTLPSWWAYKNVGTCRQNSMGLSIDTGGIGCPDWASGKAVGGIGAYSIGAKGPSVARIIAVTAVPASATADLTGRSEYFAFRLTINHQKTVGTGACASCTTPVCILLNSVTMQTGTQSTSRWLTGPANQVDSDFATWQGGGVPSSPLGTGCPAATPTKQQTWGAVKSLYR